MVKKGWKSGGYTGIPVRLTLPAIPRFADGVVPPQSVDERAEGLPAELPASGVETLPVRLAAVQRESEALLRHCRDRVRHGDRLALWDLLEMNPEFIRDPWVRAEAFRLIKGGLTRGRRGRHRGTTKADPFVVVGLVCYLIESGRVKNKEQAFAELDALGWLPYGTVKDLFYRALREKRFRPQLVGFPELAKEVSSEEYEAILNKARVLERGKEIKAKVRRGKLKGLEIKIRGT